MPHPIYGSPTHVLEIVSARLVVPRRENGHTTLLTITGECSTQRASLWTYKVAWGHEEQRRGLEPTDTLHWAMLAAAQDRPNTQTAFDRCITPGGWEDVQLPM